jgi:hypothetical protein
MLGLAAAVEFLELLMRLAQEKLNRHPSMRRPAACSRPGRRLPFPILRRGSDCDCRRHSCRFASHDYYNRKGLQGLARSALRSMVYGRV